MSNQRIFEKNVYSVAVGHSVLYMSIRAIWLIVLLRSVIEYIFTNLSTHLSIVPTGLWIYQFLLVVQLCFIYRILKPFY